VTLAEQAVHHLAAHHSQADKSEFCHPAATSTQNEKNPNMLQI
jgi:hypothetical protein